MTNTLHRKGEESSLKNDFVIFASPKGKIPGIGKKLAEFTRILLKHNPVNIGRLENGALRHVDPRNITEEMEGQLGLEAAFDNTASLAGVIKDLKKADLGISINVSGLLTEVKECCKQNGMSPHSVEQSLGIFGNNDLLPSPKIVEINTLCGHGMVSFNLIKKVIDEIKAGRMSTEKGSLMLAKPCECGAFNPSRAKEVLEEMVLKG